MRAGASIAKEIVRRIDELFAIERESPFADPGESVNRFEEQSSAPKPPQSRPSTAQTKSYDIRTSFSACAGAFDLLPIAVAVIRAVGVELMLGEFETNA